MAFQFKQYQYSTISLIIVLSLHVIGEILSAHYSHYLVANVALCIIFVIVTYAALGYYLLPLLKSHSIIAAIICYVKMMAINVVLVLGVIKNISDPLEQALLLTSQIQGCFVFSFTVFDGLKFALPITGFNIFLDTYFVANYEIRYHFVIVLLSTSFYSILAIYFYKQSESLLINTKAELQYKTELFSEFFNRLDHAATIFSSNFNLEFVNNAMKLSPFNVSNSLSFYNLTKRIIRKSDSISLSKILAVWPMHKSIDHESEFLMYSENEVRYIKILFIEGPYNMQLGLLFIDETFKKEEQSLMKYQHAFNKIVGQLCQEIRAPMNGLVNTIENAEKLYPNDELVHLIYMQARLLIINTEDLLDYLLIQCDKYLSNESTFKIEDLLNEICKIHLPYIKNNGCELSVCMLNATYIYSDYERLIQILSSLINYSLIPQNRGGRIELCVSIEDSKKLKFEIAHAKCCNNDYKSDIANMLIQKLGGELTYTVEQDFCSYRFLVDNIYIDNDELIPSEYNANDDSIQEKSSQFLFSTLAIHEIAVLLVDNCPSSRIALRLILERSKSVALEAINGGEAVDVFKSFRSKYNYWVLFVDMNIPDISGLELSKKIMDNSKSIDMTVRIYILSRLSSVQERASCLLSGVDGYFTKPVSYENIRKVLKMNHIDLT